MKHQKQVLEVILEAKAEGKKLLVQLLDPDKIISFDTLCENVRSAEKAGVDMFFFGGSLITREQEFDYTAAIGKISKTPIVTFPSSPLQISKHANAILFLSLISGRNPEFLIGHHVVAAPMLRNTGVEILPTGYLLVNCGSVTTAQYMSATTALPYDKPEIAATTAMAGEMLGLKLIYLDGGSGALQPVSPQMVKAVRQAISCPLIVGGGIRDAKTAELLFSAGADIVVIGNAAEHNPGLLADIGLKKQALS